MGDVRGVLAVDLGGTNLRVAAISTSGEMLVRDSAPSDPARGPDSVIERMADLCQRVAARAGLAETAPIGVASPGPLDPKTGVVLFTPNLTGWRDVPLGASLSKKTGRYVRVANDANCAALGEARFGAAVGYEHLVYLGLGTGVGGGVIVNGEMYEGGYGLGAELGHLPVGHARDPPAGHEQSLVADAVGLEGALVVVRVVPVDLDDQALLGPVQVDLDVLYVAVADRLRQAVLA